MRNIVCITYDSLRADHCSHLGYHRNTTPNLDAMAEEGTTFKNAIAPASRTNPAMAGALTGQPMVVRDRVANPDYAREHLARHGTIAERLSDRGYATGAFCPNAYASRYYGFDRGFDLFEDFMFDSDLYQSLFEEHLSDSSIYTMIRNLRNFVRREEAFRTWDTYIDQVESWIRQQDGPFFLWVFSLDTHFPYLTPSADRRWSNVFEMYYYNWRCNQLIDQFDIDLSEKEKNKIIDIYDDSIRFGDSLVGELQDRLEDFNPVFVVHGDHGEAFDERGVYGHFYPSLYKENIHVPLVLSEPSVGPIEKPISLLRLPQIIEELANLQDINPRDWSDDWVFATDYDGRTDRNLTAIRTQEMKFLRERSDGDGSEELQFLGDEDRELGDITDDWREVEEPLRKLLDRRDSHEKELLRLRQGGRDLISSSDSINQL